MGLVARGCEHACYNINIISPHACFSHYSTAFDIKIFLAFRPTNNRKRISAQPFKFSLSPTKCNLQVLGQAPLALLLSFVLVLLPYLFHLHSFILDFFFAASYYCYCYVTVTVAVTCGKVR